MWYYLHKDGFQVDVIHQPTDKIPFESFDLHYLVENLFIFPDETIPTFFARVCSSISNGACATIDGSYWSVTYESD